MSEPPTPETDRAEYEIRLGKHRRMVVRPSLARDLERQRDEARKSAQGLADAMVRYAHQRDAYAETLREIDLSGMVGNVVRNRHPELAQASPTAARDAEIV